MRDLQNTDMAAMQKCKFSIAFASGQGTGGNVKPENFTKSRFQRRGFFKELIRSNIIRNQRN